MFGGVADGDAGYVLLLSGGIVAGISFLVLILILHPNVHHQTHPLTLLLRLLLTDLHPKNLRLLLTIVLAIHPI